jgi:hypothetical protein
MRYADVLLMAAEAEIEAGSLEKAREYVNMVRERAANSVVTDPETGAPEANYVISTYDSPWTDAATARAAVRFERKLELALEGVRFFDLVRWGIADSAVNAYFDYEGTRLQTNLGGSEFTPNQDEYLPIPQTQRDRQQVEGSDGNSSVLVQNQGYN